MPEPVAILEALLFASDAPLEADRIREVLGLADVDEARVLVEALRAQYAGAGRALQVAEVGGGYRMLTRPEVAPWLVRLARTRTRQRLSRPALETLAIIAYKQPVSRPEIDIVRGVNSEGVLENLLERRLVRIAGRKDAPGRPYLFETTREFLVAFGLRDLGDLPAVEGELVLPELAPVGGGAPTPSDGADEMVIGEEARPSTGVGAAVHGEAQAQQDPGAGGADVTTGR
jgi:segregation and condensation protein B